MRPTTKVAPEDTLERAATELRRNGGGVLPIVNNDILVGIVSDASLAVAMAEGIEISSPCELAMVNGETIAPYATGAEALRRLADGDSLPMVVLDDLGKVMGLLSAADLYPKRHSPPRPAMVGGMATPFGVYLTNGAIGAGSGGLALVATGATMLVLLLGSNLLVGQLIEFWGKHGLSVTFQDYLGSALSILCFLLGMRLLPISGTHGAEHMVVHAIERGEELTPEIVSRMPRVHPRCGTNLAVAATIFLSLNSMTWPKEQEARLLLSAIVTFSLWKPVGSFLQQFVTTRPPNRRQLESGIRAGTELLDKFARSHVTVPTIPRRLWNSGLFHVMAGSTSAAIVLQLVGSYFKLDFGLW
jgi:CBS domain-containing protein